MRKMWTLESNSNQKFIFRDENVAGYQILYIRDILKN